MQDLDYIHQDDANEENGNDTESPSVQSEKDPSPDDMPEESVDIADEMGKIGKNIDPEHPKPLGE